MGSALTSSLWLAREEHLGSFFFSLLGVKAAREVALRIINSALVSARVPLSVDRLEDGLPGALSQGRPGPATITSTAADALTRLYVEARACVCVCVCV